MGLTNDDCMMLEKILLARANNVQNNLTPEQKNGSRGSLMRL